MKSSLGDLALFGGPPAFVDPLHVGRPNIGDRAALRTRLEAMLDRRWLTNHGPYVTEFERRVAGLVGVRHCVATCNATVGIEVAARALGLTGEIIVPSFTFVGTAHALRWQGITPVFCDIDRRTHNIDPGRVEALITPRTTGIIGVHVWGRPCDVKALGDIARRRGLRLLFDAAHALGCAWQGRMLGSFGDAEVLSFHATKVANAFEGGAIVTNDDEVARRARLLHACGFAEEDLVVSEGTNAKMSEASAAMGLTSLESLDVFVAANRRNHAAYARELAGLPGVQACVVRRSAAAQSPLRRHRNGQRAAGIHRDVLQRILRAENILARRYFPGCHQMEPYRTIDPDAGLRLPATVSLAARVMQLPTGTTVSRAAIERVCAILRLALEHAAAIARREPARVAEVD